MIGEFCPKSGHFIRESACPQNMCFVWSALCHAGKNLNTERAFGCPAPLKSPPKITLFRTLSLDIAQTSPSSGPGEFNSGVQWHQSYLATDQKAHSPISIMGNKKKKILFFHLVGVCDTSQIILNLNERKGSSLLTT